MPSFGDEALAIDTEKFELRMQPSVVSTSMIPSPLATNAGGWPSAAGMVTMPLFFLIVTRPVVVLTISYSAISKAGIVIIATLGWPGCCGCPGRCCGLLRCMPRGPPRW